MSYTIETPNIFNIEIHKQNYTVSLNDITNYKKIFSRNIHNIHNTQNHQKNANIIMLKKNEYDIFYSCKYKYPLLVKETISITTGYPGIGENPIDRRKIIDPFRQDPDIPNTCSHTLEDYKQFMAYGGSMGHNAPAGQHKTNMDIFSETFQLSNITPQEMVFNCGLWAIMENWCKNLQNNNHITNITVFTGSIPNTHNFNFNGVNMNIPLKMFKIICFNSVGSPDITHMEILIANNQPFFINPNLKYFDLTNYLVPIKSYNWFQNFSGINLQYLLNYYNYNTNKILTFRNFINLKFYMYPAIKLLMLKSNWFGYIIYADNITLLENVWQELQKYSKEFDTLEYHKEYYDLVKNRLLRDGNNIHKYLYNIKHNTKNTIKYTTTTTKHTTTKHTKKSTNI